MITLAATTFASPQRAWLDAREQISCVGYNVLPCCIMATDSVTATCFPLASRLISDIGEARPEWRAPPFLLRRPSRVAVFVRRVCASARPFTASDAWPKTSRSQMGHYSSGRTSDLPRNLTAARNALIFGTRELAPCPFAAPPQSGKPAKRDSAQNTPAMWPQRQHPNRVGDDQYRHPNQERSGETAMSPAAPSGVHDTSRTHGGQHDGPDDRAGRRFQPHGGQHG